MFTILHTDVCTFTIIKWKRWVCVCVWWLWRCGKEEGNQTCWNELQSTTIATAKSPASKSIRFARASVCSFLSTLSLLLLSLSLFCVPLHCCKFIFRYYPMYVEYIFCYPIYYIYIRVCDMLNNLNWKCKSQIALNETETYTMHVDRVFHTHIYIEIFVLHFTSICLVL